MWPLIYKDILISKKSLLILLAFALMYPFIINGKDLNSAAASVLIVGFSFFLTAVEIEERDKSYRMIHSLPVSKKDSVIARYVGSISISLIGVFAVSMLIKLVSLFFNLNLGCFNYKSIINYFVWIIIAGGIIMCITYCFGYKAARVANFLVFFSLFPLFSGMFGDSENRWINYIIDIFNNNDLYMLLMKIIIAMAFYSLSMYISIVVYSNRDL